MINKFKFLYLSLFLTQVTVYGGARFCIREPIVDYSCGSDVDCVVKTTGSIGDNSPECVNKRYKPNPYAFEAWREANGIVEVSSWEKIDYCVCEDGQCSERNHVSDGPYPRRQEPPAEYAQELPAEPVARPVVDYSCGSDADCVIKTTGRMQRGFKDCVNKDFTPDPGAFEASRVGQITFTGWRHIDYCVCKHGRCSGVCKHGRCSGRQGVRDGPYPGRQKSPAPVNAMSGPTTTPATSTPAFAPRSMQELPAEPVIDYSCRSKRDCVIKTTGRICDNSIDCVNKRYKPNPDAFAAWRAGKGHILGWPGIDYCVCEDGRCSGRTVVRDGPGPGWNKFAPRSYYELRAAIHACNIM